MLTLLAVIWIVVALSCHYHRYQFYEKRPYLKNRRGEGLVAFSERQYWWLMTLWPLTVVAVILYGIMIIVCAILEIVVNWWESRIKR
jgi:hypothetical protein